MKCEHGLTTKECYVCMSPKYGKHDTKQERVAKPQEKRHEWVGLTLDEIDLLEELYAPPVHPDFVNDASHCLELIRHVEAKLKEKNA